MKNTLLFAVFFIMALLLTACKKDIKESEAQQAISQDVLSKIQKLGFGISSVQKVEGGYLVEDDILLTDEHLNGNPKMEILRVGSEEQYRTSNTVLGLPRTITIRVSTSLPSVYVTALNAAIARYNALKTTTTNFLLTFVRVTSGGNIVINPAPAGSPYLASAGFPSDAGNPYTQILVNASIVNSWAANTKTTILAHEIGHCIGLRHTDWFNRSFSCGGSAVNEGAGSVGAKLIPGTPSGAEAGSWMLACIGNGTNRPFTANDVIALRWLY
ncbi:M57 family metalloprotease [Chitinophagaceae bacterium LB-8]|uniref:M57 family metalloprotease n=1 Tax=Paraflavisolibacter caeni TaxID=2982496 RepID=A0A9X2XMZ5_9BACT|nr:M57 family metalloprotease [Paraflavisolibacter caeni]MCU7547544.1 M57 family metalloprotease [Paraflavisolibacter caeni]